MQKTAWCSSLLLLIVLLVTACTSSVRAPVDSRDKKLESQASYSWAEVDTLKSKQQNDYHVVVKGDTLYSIAWRYGHDHRDLADWNGIVNKHVIFPGQLIYLKARPIQVLSQKYGSVVSTKKNKNKQSKAPKTPAKTTKQTSYKPTKKSKKVSSGSVKWQWPTKGELVKLKTPTSKKGVDIAGRVGQSIKAAAAGDVVYSGSGLLGYGNLIIIKHNDTFLSAYAHNEKIYANEGDKVRAGEKIATMGIDNKGSPILHFEIRMDGSPVNPLQHLPSNKS